MKNGLESRRALYLQDMKGPSTPLRGRFETIICAVEEVLEPILVIEPLQILTSDVALNAQIFNYVRSIATRYHGIGRNRAIVDYDHLVTGYTFPLGDVHKGLPRLANTSGAVRLQLRAEVTEMVLEGLAKRTAGLGIGSK